MRSSRGRLHRRRSFPIVLSLRIRILPTAQPRADEKPPIEYGLIISETLLGALTAAGVALLPYFLLLQDYVENGTGGLFAGQDTIGAVIYFIIFAAVPSRWPRRRSHSRTAAAGTTRTPGRRR